MIEYKIFESKTEEDLYKLMLPFLSQGWRRDGGPYFYGENYVQYLVKGEAIDKDEIKLMLHCQQSDKLFLITKALCAGGLEVSVCEPIDIQTWKLTLTPPKPI